MASTCNWEPCDNQLFPENFPEVAGKTFLWVKINKKEFCEFVKFGMKNTTGLFLAFQEYLLKHN